MEAAVRDIGWGGGGDRAAESPARLAFGRWIAKAGVVMHAHEDSTPIDQLHSNSRCIPQLGSSFQTSRKKKARHGCLISKGILEPHADRIAFQVCKLLDYIARFYSP
jgi:hypothetical protein